MRIVVLDGMGGGIGVQLITRLRKEFGAEAEIIALGTNAVATDRMIRAGADRGATGENAVRVSIRLAEYIVAPIGAVLADSMMGEITSGIAEAVLGSTAEKFILPVVQQHFTIIGLETKPLAQLADEAVTAIRERSAHRG